MLSFFIYLLGHILALEAQFIERAARTAAAFQQIDGLEHGVIVRENVHSVVLRLYGGVAQVAVVAVTAVAVTEFLVRTPVNRLSAFQAAGAFFIVILVHSLKRFPKYREALSNLQETEKIVNQIFLILSAKTMFSI